MQTLLMSARLLFYNFIPITGCFNLITFNMPRFICRVKNPVSVKALIQSASDSMNTRTFSRLQKPSADARQGIFPSAKVSVL